MADKTKRKGLRQNPKKGFKYKLRVKKYNAQSGVLKRSSARVQIIEPAIAVSNTEKVATSDGTTIEVDVDNNRLNYLYTILDNVDGTIDYDNLELLVD